MAAAGVLVAAATVSGVAYATIGGAGSVYTACMLKGVGTIRLIDKSLPAANLMSHCTDKETEISWNQTGQPGLSGPQGAKGDPGAPGTNGTNGTDGKNGVSVTSSSEPAGANCAAGGVQLTAANGVNFVCNGAKGERGDPGPAGAVGPKGDKGDPGNLALAGRECASGTFVAGFDSSGDPVCAAGSGSQRIGLSLLQLVFPSVQVGGPLYALDVGLTVPTDSDVLIGIEGPDASDFSFEGCGLTQQTVFAEPTVPEPGCALQVDFEPTGLGERTATLTVQRPGANSVSVQISGTGV
jgi:hypothetical protein